MRKKEQKTAKIKGVMEGLSKLGDKFEQKDKSQKFDILGNNNSKKKTPELFGNGQNNKFKF